MKLGLTPTPFARHVPLQYRRQSVCEPPNSAVPDGEVNTFTTRHHGSLQVTDMTARQGIFAYHGIIASPAEPGSAILALYKTDLNAQTLTVRTPFLIHQLHGKTLRAYQYNTQQDILVTMYQERPQYVNKAVWYTNIA